jgi:hypothetical protein
VEKEAFVCPSFSILVLVLELLSSLVVRVRKLRLSPQQLAPTVCVWLEYQTQNVHKEEENRPNDYDVDRRLLHSVEFTRATDAISDGVDVGEILRGEDVGGRGVARI